MGARSHVWEQRGRKKNIWSEEEEEKEEDFNTSQKTQRLHYKYYAVNGFTKIIPVYCDSHNETNSLNSKVIPMLN
jgi:hypothetical protein